jgi:hypothetical protein
MATSAKRHGVSVNDPEAEARLRRAEQALEKKQDANYISEAGSQRRARAELPAVSGIVIDDSVLGSNSIRWDALDINVFRYEVQIDTEAGFSTPDTFKVTEPQFVLPGTLDPSLTYYARVRGVGTRVKQGFHDVGDWSSTLTFTPGQAVSNNLQAGAAGNVIKYEFSDTAFRVLQVVTEPAVGDSELDQEILDIPQFELPTSATCLFIVMHQFQWGFRLTDLPGASIGILRSDSIRFRLYLDGQPVFTYSKAFQDNATTRWDLWRDTITLVGPPQALAAGVHKLKYRIELLRDDTSSSSSACFLTTQNVVVSVLEVRR